MEEVRKWRTHGHGELGGDFGGGVGWVETEEDIEVYIVMGGKKDMISPNR